MKELGELQESASQQLHSGKSRLDVIAIMTANDIDELTATRIVDAAALRLRREVEGDSPVKPAKNIFNYSTIAGTIFLTAGLGAIGYAQVSGNASEMTYYLAGGAIFMGLFRLARGIMR
jgi:hypothetical protein